MTAGALTAAFLVVRSCTPEQQPAPPPAPPPAPRTLEAWETTNAIAVAFDTRGRMYAGVAWNYFQADRVASKACTAGIPRDEYCFGISVHESETPGKACIGIGIDHFNRPRPGDNIPARDRVSYVITRAATPEEAQTRLTDACTARAGQCRLTRGVYCNFR